MKDIASLNRISSLSAYLHDEFVFGGEIPPACYIEKLISECEPDFLSQLTNEEIFTAIRNATNSSFGVHHLIQRFTHFFRKYNK